MPSVRFRLNGAELEVDADPDRALLDVLRGQLGVTGPHLVAVPVNVAPAM